MLSGLYNVSLKPELAKRFRIVMTQRLLGYFLGRNDIGICILTKFIRSCLYMLLSKSELNQVCISSREADMLAKCLEGHDAFFGGYDSLLKTIGNLALVPKNRQVFFDTGMISMLKDVALSKPLVSEVFNSLLNLIPAADESSGRDKAPPYEGDSVKVLLKSDHSFMKLIHSSSKEVCKGLKLLLCPPQKPGNEGNDNL